MNTPIFTESHTVQIPALQLLINMGYQYLPSAKALALRGGTTAQVLLEEVLKTQLRKINAIQRRGKTYSFSEANIQNAIRAIKELPLDKGFMTANQTLYDLIVMGKSFEQTIEGDKKSHTLHYIDWENPANNQFHVTQEYRVVRTDGKDHYRPDLVLFINGIPTVIIECKVSSLPGTLSPIKQGIEQHLRNGSKDGIRKLYVYSNLLLSIAGNDGCYGTTNTPLKFWSTWRELFHTREEQPAYEEALATLKNTPLTAEQKELLFAKGKGNSDAQRSYFDSLEAEERPLTEQDKLLYSLCTPQRLLDLIRNFILYEDGMKKIARYQQFFAVKRTQERVAHVDPATGKRQGGVIWHTQGSGKSLSMVLIAQMLATHPNITNAKIILVTDRIDLDDQITDTFKRCRKGEKEIERAKSGTHLAQLLEKRSSPIVTTVINKFETPVKKIKPLTSSEIFILVDEGHRTQYDSLSADMRRVLPNGCFIAFTGTPLMKEEKHTANKFGGYIGHPYTVLDAVKDGAILPLLYEGRHQRITIDNEPLLDQSFHEQTDGLSEYGRTKLKQKVSTAHEINKMDPIVYARAQDISEHYSNFFQTQGGSYKPKAQLVAPNIKTALRYKEYLDQIGKVSSQVVVSHSGHEQQVGNYRGNYGKSDIKAFEEASFKKEKDQYGSLEKYEKSVISKFKKEPHPELLIVVNKLLTGFDAPSNTVLYLCRSLKDHALLQAIARVNRVHEGKEYGYIIDYYGNLENLDTALGTSYVGGDALQNFDAKDLKGMWASLMQPLEKLPEKHSAVWSFFPGLKNKNVGVAVYEEKLYLEDVRNKFYEKVSQFARLLKIGLSCSDFMATTAEERVASYKKDLKFFLKLRVSVLRRYNDEIAYKDFEPQIQQLVNKHIATEGEIFTITPPVNVFDKKEREKGLENITDKAGRADHMASRTLRAIRQKMEEDPIYFKKLSSIIQETMEAYHKKRLGEEGYLKKISSLEKEFLEGRRQDIPKELVNNGVALSFYDFSKEIFKECASETSPFHVEVGLTIDKIIKEQVYPDGKKRVDWHFNEEIKKGIRKRADEALEKIMDKFGMLVAWYKIDEIMPKCLDVATIKYK